MAPTRWTIAVLLALHSPLVEAQRQQVQIPANLTAAQRQQLINRCKKDWQNWCSQLGLRKPQASTTSDGPQTNPNDPTQQCYVHWQQYCTRYNIPDPAQTQVNEQGSQDREQAIRQCRRHWRPGCDRLGVPKPEEPPPSEGPILLPVPVPVFPPAASRPPAFECEFDWSERCGTEVEAVQSLLQYGPSGVTYPDPQKFSATGFIRSGWPIVVKYQTPAGARATLTINPQYGRGRRFQVMLPTSIDGSPQTYSFVAQVDGSDGNLLVADYKITAKYYVKGARDPDAPVQVLGFGAGDRAATAAKTAGVPALFDAVYLLPGVATRSELPVRPASFAAAPDYAQPVAINDVNFRPPVVDRPSDNGTVALTYSYILNNEWDRVAEDLWRSCNGVLRCNLYHPQHPYAPTSEGAQTWQWNINHGTPLGLYQLVVRAWRTCGAMVDPNSYFQCGNSADWVVGSAGPISVTER